MDSIVKYLIGTNQIKYVVLDELFKPIKKTIKQDRVVWHFDIWNVLHRFYEDRNSHLFTSIEEEIVVRNIVVGILNMIGHYRKYTSVKLQKESVFLLYFNFVPPEYHKRIDPEYKRKNIFSKFDENHKDYNIINRLVLKSLKMLQNLVMYVENVYWIYNIGIDTPTAIGYAIHTKVYRNDFHIMFMRDELTIQLLTDNVIQLYQKKNDASYIITKDNFYEKMFKKPFNKADMEGVTPNSVRFLFAVNGCSDAGYKEIRLGTDPSVFKKLAEAYQEKSIDDNSSMQTVLDVLSKNKGYKKIIEAEGNTELFIQRFKFYNIRLSARSISETLVKHMYHAHFDLYDQEALEALNELLVALDENNDIVKLEDLSMAEGMKWN